MSYDVTIFFGGPSELLSAEASDLVAACTGITLKAQEFGNPPMSWGRLLGLLVHLEPRPSFVREVGRQSVVELAFSLCLGVQAGSACNDIIHPVAFHIARDLSRRLQERTVLCLAGIEFVGAVFEKGQLVLDQMDLPSSPSVGRWRYTSRPT